MTFHVEFSVRSLHDLDILYFEKNVAESSASARWFNGLAEGIDSLATFPNRCPTVPESEGNLRKLRHLLYGKKPHVYRVIYEVDEDLRLVKVYHIRHGARQAIKPPDVQ